MNPIRTATTTNVLGAPQGWDAEAHGPCIGLPITASEGVLYSYWATTWRERWAILCGRPVRLAVASSSHPPVAINTDT